MFRYAKNVRLASFLSLSGSLWLSVTPTLAPSGSNLLSQAFTGSLRGSLWLSVTPTLALTATLWHTLALSGSLFSLISRAQYLIGSQGP